ncbi:alpha-ribazole phosphatase CobZ [Methanobrevibacter filiformis]|uniref:Phosphatidylglycerophosphatase A n=1 Tax=Methanobrevibacter filiformis TaxID=55758 RepID=A0A165YUJ5_9EURY|nr:alpha-ribazole phosphatase CobZ [Methanobrevibacter filiformis]KZX09884.1 phosphatidylglycerophosphatase A [Methanobrevibacter filiformis]
MNIYKGKNEDNELFNNIQYYGDSKVFYITNPGYFFTMSDLSISNGIDLVKNIVIFSDEQNELDKMDLNSYKNEINKLCEKNKRINGTYIADIFKTSDYFVEHSENLSIINFPDTTNQNVNITKKLKVSNNTNGLNSSKIDLGQIIIINETLSIEELIKFHKIAIESKITYFKYKKLPEHIDETINNNEFLIIACPIAKSLIGSDTNNINHLLNKSLLPEKGKTKIENIQKEIATTMVLSCKNFLENYDINFGILDYIFAEGISLDELVDAGMELCVGVEETQEIRDKLKKQLLRSLEDINVIALLMSAIRCEEDFQNKRIREVNIEDDPAYLYTDEVLGIAIANQIAGTKATFNFKRYDELKPGILSELGPMVDDIFAGLVAGSMSKIFEPK